MQVTERIGEAGYSGGMNPIPTGSPGYAGLAEYSNRLALDPPAPAQGASHAGKLPRITLKLNIPTAQAQKSLQRGQGVMADIARALGPDGSGSIDLPQDPSARKWMLYCLGTLQLVPPHLLDEAAHATAQTGETDEPETGWEEATGPDTLDTNDGDLAPPELMSRFGGGMATIPDVVKPPPGAAEPADPGAVAKPPVSALATSPPELPVGPTLPMPMVPPQAPMQAGKPHKAPDAVQANDGGPVYVQRHTNHYHADDNGKEDPAAVG